MSRTTTAVRLALAALVSGVATDPARALEPQDPAVIADARVQDDELYTVEELDNLLAPVALYPDPILAELFVAATYPEQVQLAARYVETYGTEGIDEQAWDVSVKAIARYAPVLNMLAERPNWATAVGRAYATQPGDAMASVQNLRRMARAQGNLVSTPQQRVEVEREYIRIVPAQPRVVYVPVYDPYVVYYRPVNYVHVATPYWSFGVGFPIGVWLTYDLDWDTRVVYYHGWHGHGRRHTWYHVSRPFITFNSWYVGPRYSVVVINRTIVHRHVNYWGFDHYNVVHRTTKWDRPRIPGQGYYGARPAKRLPQDRYGIPARRDLAVNKPAKPVGGSVPRVGGAAPRGDDEVGGRPPRGNGNRPPVGGDRPDRGNGNDRNGGRGNGNAGRGSAGPSAEVGRLPVSEDRVKPVRIGGNTRPLYPRGEDIAPERIKGGAPDRREVAAGNGTWNPRGGSDRVSPPSRGMGNDRAASPVLRRDADPVRAPRASADRQAPRGGFDRPSSSGRLEAPRSARTDAPRGYEPRFERSAPQAERSAPRYERSEPRSAPRASAPRASEPRMRAPRGGEPRVSAPRSSEPRVSAPRSSAPRASAPRSSGGSRGGGSAAPRAPKSPRGN